MGENVRGVGDSRAEAATYDELPRGVVPIVLPGGAVVAARITPTGEYRDVGAGRRAAAKLERLGELIGGVGSAVLDAAAAVAPDEASISFGVELTAKSGIAFAVLAEGEAKTSLQVTLTWQLKDGQRANGRGPDDPPSGGQQTARPDADA